MLALCGVHIASVGERQRASTKWLANRTFSEPLCASTLALACARLSSTKLACARDVYTPLSTTQDNTIATEYIYASWVYPGCVKYQISGKGAPNPISFGITPLPEM